jgi:hypothetical protein
MRRLFIYRLMLGLGIAVVLTACDMSPVAPTPTAVPVVPTPTATVVEPSATSTAIPTSTQAPTERPTASPSTPPATLVPSVPSRLESITYLAADGATVESIKPDGSASLTVFTISKPKGSVVTSLSTALNGGHSYFVYAISKELYDPSPEYFWWDGRTTRQLGSFVYPPRWSPDNSRLVGQSTGEASALNVFKLGVREDVALPSGSAPDWFPNGKKLIYVSNNNIFSYDLDTKAKQQLTNLPTDEKTNSWFVQEAHVLPDGQRIVFYGGQFMKNGEAQLGASGNGQQWWWIPVAGGEPQPWTEQGGNGISDYTASKESQRFAYHEGAHSSACVSVPMLGVVDATKPGSAPIFADVPEFAEREDGAAFVQGISWSLQRERLAFGVQSYTCPQEGTELTLGTPTIYIWQPGSGQAPTKLVEGSFPTWTYLVR